MIAIIVLYVSAVLADTIGIYCPYCNHAGVEVLNETEGVCECGSCHRMMLVLNGNIYTDDDRQLLLLSYVIYPGREEILANMATESDIGTDEPQNAENVEGEKEVDATSNSVSTKDSSSTTTSADRHTYSAELENVETGSKKSSSSNEKNNGSSNIGLNNEEVKASVSQIGEKLKSSVSEFNTLIDYNSFKNQKISTYSDVVFKDLPTYDNDSFRASDSEVMEKIDLVDTESPVNLVVIILSVCIIGIGIVVLIKYKTY